MARDTRPLTDYGTYVESMMDRLPWMTRKQVDEFIREDKHYVAILSTPDGKEWVDTSDQYYITQSIKKVQAERLARLVQSLAARGQRGDMDLSLSAPDANLLLAYFKNTNPDLFETPVEAEATTA